LGFLPHRPEDHRRATKLSHSSRRKKTITRVLMPFIILPKYDDAVT